jgi:hypothetical protein
VSVSSENSPEDGEQDLVETRKAHRGLELDATCTQNVHSGLRGRTRCHVEKHCLADPCFAQDEQGVSVFTDARQKRVKYRQLFSTADRVPNGIRFRKS